MLLGLGVASLYNHSRSPSLDYRIDANLIIRFSAARDIKVRAICQVNGACEAYGQACRYIGLSR